MERGGWSEVNSIHPPRSFRWIHRPVMGMRLAIVLAGIVAWWGLDPLPWPARIYALFLLIGVPVLAVAQLRLAGAAQTLPRLPVYLSSAVTLWLLALLALASARASQMSMRALGLTAVSPVAIVAWSLGLLGLIVVLAVALRAAGIRESRLVAELLPRNRRERIAFVFLSFSAGVGEELVYRGFLLAALEQATGSTLLAVVLSSIAFGVVHAYQKPGGALRAGFLGLILAVPVLVTGSIIPSMVAHFAYDVVAGLWLGPWIVRE